MIHDGPGGNAKRVRIKCDAQRSLRTTFQRFWLVRARASLALAGHDRNLAASQGDYDAQKGQPLMVAIRCEFYLYQEAGFGAYGVYTV